MPRMFIPTVIEAPIELEPVTADTFVADLEPALARGCRPPGERRDVAPPAGLRLMGTRGPHGAADHRRLRLVRPDGRLLAGLRRARRDLRGHSRPASGDWVGGLPARARARWSGSSPSRGCSRSPSGRAPGATRLASWSSWPSRPRGRSCRSRGRPASRRNPYPIRVQPPDVRSGVRRDPRYMALTAPAHDARATQAVVRGHELTKRFGEGDAAVDALRGVDVEFERGRSPRSWGRRAPASRR